MTPPRKLAIIALAITAAAHADIAAYLQNIAAGSAIESALYKIVNLGPTAIPLLRPPRETRPELDKLPNTPELHRIRALEAERALDFAAAEAAWKQHADPTALADFHHRRARPMRGSQRSRCRIPPEDCAASSPARGCREWILWRRFEGIGGGGVAAAVPQAGEWARYGAFNPV